MNLPHTMCLKFDSTYLLSGSGEDIPHTHLCNITYVWSELPKSLFVKEQIIVFCMTSQKKIRHGRGINIRGSPVLGRRQTSYQAMSRPIRNESSQTNLKICKSVNSVMISEKRRQKSKQDSDGQKSGSAFLVILTAEQARTIYQLRSVSTAQDSSACSVAGKSSLVSEIFGVSPKTIRDVWNRKTWTQVPFHTWWGRASPNRTHVVPNARSRGPFGRRRRYTCTSGST
jgi:hypothetical protein